VSEIPYGGGHLDWVDPLVGEAKTTGRERPPALKKQGPVGKRSWKLPFKSAKDSLWGNREKEKGQGSNGSIQPIYAVGGDNNQLHKLEKVPAIGLSIMNRHVHHEGEKASQRQLGRE